MGEPTIETRVAPGAKLSHLTAGLVGPDGELVQGRETRRQPWTIHGRKLRARCDSGL